MRISSSHLAIFTLLTAAAGCSDGSSQLNVPGGGGTGGSTWQGSAGIAGVGAAGLGADGVGAAGVGTAGTGAAGVAGTGAAGTGAAGVGTAGTGAAGTGTVGSCTNVRPTGTQWDEATCDQWATQTSECPNAWMVDNHYCDQSCGRCSGGAAGTGGTAGTSGAAGTGAGGVPSTCSAADLEVCQNETNQHCGYTYEYWKDSGDGCLVNTADGFSVNWSNIGNLLGRKGLRPGSKSQIVTYSADYQPNGNKIGRAHV